MKKPTPKDKNPRTLLSVLATFRRWSYLISGLGFIILAMAYLGVRTLSQSGVRNQTPILVVILYGALYLIVAATLLGAALITKLFALFYLPAEKNRGGDGRLAVFPTLSIVWSVGFIVGNILLIQSRAITRSPFSSLLKHWLLPSHDAGWAFTTLHNTILPMVTLGLCGLYYYLIADNKVPRWQMPPWEAWITALFTFWAGITLLLTGGFF
jgi:hypothetical protein